MSNKERRTGEISGAFSRDAHVFGRLDAASSRAGFTSSRPPPPWTSVFQFSLFLHIMTYGLEKLGLDGKKLLERDLSALLLKKNAGRVCVCCMCVFITKCMCLKKI